MLGAMSIVTKTGDKGETGLLYGGRVSKDDPRVEAFGTIDEAVAALGLARALSAYPRVKEVVLAIQKELFVVGSELATDPREYKKFDEHFTRVTAEMVQRLEETIDQVEPPGVDLVADEGDIVVAMEDGEVIGMLPFHHGTWSVYVRNADGKVVNYGEVAKHSWVEFDLPMQVIDGQTETVLVRAGDPLGRIGLQTGGGTMLHFETYAPDITLAHVRAGGLQWPHGENAPHGLLDPSAYLVAAQHKWYFDKQDPIT